MRRISHNSVNLQNDKNVIYSIDNRVAYYTFTVQRQTAPPSPLAPLVREAGPEGPRGSTGNSPAVFPLAPLCKGSRHGIAVPEGLS